MLPEFPLGTFAVMLVGENTVKEVAGMPPKLTEVVPVKLVPVITTLLAIGADEGVKEVIVGADTNTNPGAVLTPFGVFTITDPDAPLPTARRR